MSLKTAGDRKKDPLPTHIEVFKLVFHYAKNAWKYTNERDIFIVDMK